MATQPIPTPASAAPAAPAGIPVPLSALAQPDDKEQMQTPAEGDTVSLQVDATIISVQGETAMIQPTAVNGQPLDKAGEQTPDNEGDETMNPDNAEASLRGAIGQSNG